jgi:hypothetical protein
MFKGLVSVTKAALYLAYAAVAIVVVFMIASLRSSFRRKGAEGQVNDARRRAKENLKRINEYQKTGDTDALYRVLTTLSGKRR